jgi:bifunctional DNase/RNase
MQRMDIAGIGLDANSGAPLVVLRELDDPHRMLPIMIGGPEASAIAIAAAGPPPPRLGRARAPPPSRPPPGRSSTT